MTDQPKIKIIFEIDADVKGALVDVLSVISSVFAMIGENLKGPSAIVAKIPLSDKVSVTTETLPASPKTSEPAALPVEEAIEKSPIVPEPAAQVVEKQKVSTKIMVPEGRPAPKAKKAPPAQTVKGPSFDSAKLVPDEEVFQEFSKLSAAEKTRIQSYYRAGMTAVAVGRQARVNYRTVLRVMFGPREA